MPEKDKIGVVAARCIDITAVLDNAEKAKCGICGAMVWLSPAWKGKKIDCIMCEICFKIRNSADDNLIVDEQALDDAVRTVKKRGQTDSAQKIRDDMLKYAEKKFGKKLKVQNNIK